MSISVVDFFDLASLAEASYADFSNFSKMKDALLASGFSESQADLIVARWSVKAHLPNTSTGFSMSLFEGADEFVLAFRGTEPTKQWFKDIQADVGDIVADGVALDQAIDLVNYWAWIKSDGAYTAAKLEVLEAETIALNAAILLGGAKQAIYFAAMSLRDDVIIDLTYDPINDSVIYLVRRVVWEDSSTAFDDPKYQNGLGLGDDIAAKGLTVTGHSLGGHLASAFTRLFPEANAEALTINGAGFGILGFTGYAAKNVSNLFEMLFGNPSFGSSSILNLYGDKNPEFVTQDVLLKQPGGHLPIFIEQTNFYDHTLGHGTKPITDTLAVYDLFFKMDRKASLDNLLKIFNSASNSAEKSLESMVSYLADLFKVDVSLTTDDRESLYKSINAIRESSYFINVADQLKVLPHANAGLAKTDFGHFLSLYFSLPFVLQGADSTLLGLHGEIYSLWTADQSLSAEDRKNGKANFSDEWYQDRANFLSLLLERNAKDIDSTESANPSGKDIFYVNVEGFDSGSGRIFSGDVNASSINQEPAPSRVVFGTNTDNTPANTGADGFVGGNGNDRIYGLGGDDKLNGLKGNDVLDGGAGKDQLTGGEGADLLLGGAGDDILDGGADNDILKGGADNDTYKFTGNFGRDIVIDNEGTDVIDIDGVVVGELKQTAKNSITYTNAAGTVEAVLIDNGGSKTLLISSASNRSNSVTVDNWVTGQFGITLKDANEESSTLPHSVTGDSNGNQLFPHAEPNEHYSSTEIHGGLGVDFIHGSVSIDRLYGEGGNDWITAGGNYGKVSSLDNSVVIVPAGGGGKDFIDGGDGDDLISGLADQSEWYGGKGNDMLLGGSVMHMFQLSMPKIDDSVDDQLRADIAWRDFSSLLKSGFTIDQETKDGATIYGYSAWAGVEPGTYTGSSALGNGWQYRFTFSGNAQLEDASDKNRGVSSYSYLNGPEVAGLGNISLEYSHPDLNGGAFSSSNLYTQFRLTPKELASGVTKEDVKDRANLSLHGGEGDDLLLGWYARDELYGDEDNDALFASDGNDLLDGGEGNDTLAGGWGNDTLLGGDGDDLLIGDDIGASTQGTDDVLYGGAGKDTLHGSAGNDYLHGGSGDDYLSGGDGNDYLIGGVGKDELYGGDGDDTLVGGTEDRYMHAGTGKNIYIFDNIIYDEADVKAAAKEPSVNALGFTTISSQVSAQAPVSPAPLLTIEGTEGTNTLALVGASSLNQVFLTSQDNDLVLRTGNAAIYIREGLNGAVDHIAFGSSADDFIDSISSTQSTSIDDVMLARLTTEITRTAQTAGTQLAGGLSNDTLLAHEGGSILIGGQGDDTLLGNVGDDVYIIRSEDGHDSITEQGGFNTIKFAEGIAPDQIAVHNSNGNLLIIIAGSQSIVVNGMFDIATGDPIANKAIHKIEFSNREFWDLTRLLEESAKGATLVGSVHNDLLIGYESGDTLTGGKGDDKLRGGKGDDHYHFAIGDGADQVDDSHGNDHIYFAEGISETNVNLRKDINNNLVIRINNNDSITVLNAFNASGELSAQAIENIHFNDTSVWDIARIQTELAKNQPYIFSGTTGNDKLVGDNANQIFYGDKGDDQLDGGSASDVYQYALGDGKDVIKDSNGNDRLELLSGVNESEVVARSNGVDLILTLKDGGSITVQNAFGTKAENVVDPVITTLIEQLQNNWMSQAERLIEQHYGLTGSGDITLGFESDVEGAEAAHVEATYSELGGVGTNLKLVIDLNDFNNTPNGAAPYYYDRVIAHEMVHAVMARNMNNSQLPGWFTEGTAEFIHGADERVKADANIIGLESNFNQLFKTTVGSPSTSAGYSVSYIAVKLLDKEIRNHGGAGIKEVFDQLKTGKTLDQSLITVSAAHAGLAAAWNNLSTFETHFKSVGFAQYTQLLALDDLDTGSIAGSDYGFSSLNASAVISNSISGPSRAFNLIIPDQYVSTPEINGVLESIGFSSGGGWDYSRITQEVLKPTNGDDVIHSFDTDDVLSGSKGNDQLFGYAGNDVYRYALGDGNDVIVDSAGTDRIEFGEGILAADIELTRDLSNNLIVTLKDGSTIMVSSAFSEDGELSSDSIEFINFVSGDVWNSEKILQEVDRISAILVQGTHGNDVLYGSDNGDILIGGLGNDVLYGGAGMDTLKGGLGNDNLYGDSGADTYLFNLGDGQDSITDEDETAYINDRVVFGSGITRDNISFARSINDLVMFIGNGGDQITFRAHFFSNAYKIEEVDIAGEVVALDALLSSYSEVAVLGATDANNIWLYGTDNKNFIDGLGGNDYIYGYGGDDTLMGGLGKDQLYGGNDNDQLDGGEGDDILYGETGNDTLLGGLGNDLLYSGDDNDQLDGGKDNDTLHGERGNDTLLGGFGNDELYGGDDHDQLSGGEGNDTLYGGNSYQDTGNDTLWGGHGADRLEGGGGADTYIFNLGDGRDEIWDFDETANINDRIVFGAGITLGNIRFARNYLDLVMFIGDTDDQITVINYFSVSGSSEWVEEVEVAGEVVVLDTLFSSYSEFAVVGATDGVDYFLYGTEHKNLIDGLGGHDSLYGFGGDDTLLGGSGDDILWGGDGDDLVVGGEGHDVLYGGGFSLLGDEPGNDTLWGGPGSDRLLGAFGADTYLFNLGDGQDTIRDEDRAANIKDRLVFGAGITLNSISHARTGSSLVISYGNAGDQVTIESYFSGSEYKIEEVEIAGEVMMLDTLLNGQSEADEIPPAIPTASFDTAGKVISGIAEAGSTVSVKNAAGTELKSITANETTGAYSITLTTALVNNEVVNVTAKDAAGNISAIKTIVAPDKTAPALPSANFDGTGKVINGVAEAGSTVVVKNASNTSTLGTVTAHAVTGVYSITLVTALINKETVNITATDAAGNVSVARALIAPDVVAPNPTATIIQAENYTSMSGVWNEPTTDVGGGQNTGNINTGDWMAYNNVAFNVPTEGRYKITYRVASLNGGGRLALRELSNENTLGSINIPKTGAWQSWVDVTHEITLTGGEHNFKLYAENGGFNVNWFKLEPLAPVASDTTPPAQPTANFDTAGKVVSGVAEAGSTVIVKNASNTITLGTVTADAATGAYSITLGTALINSETINVAAKDAAGNISAIKTIVAPDKTAPALPSANFDVTGKVINGVAEAGSTVVVKNASNTSTLGTVTAHAVTGAYSITLVTALINKETVNITATDAAGNVSIARALIAPDVAAPNPTATIIQAENYTSMSGVWNEQTTDVGGGQNTGNINTGDWMAYNNVAFNVPTEGRYKITYRVASLNGGGRLALRELSNENTLGSINIPKTGAWQSWVDVTHEITLTGGEHNFKLYAENGGFNVNWFKLEPLAPIASDTTPPAQPTANFDTAGKVVSGVAEAGSTVVVKNASNTSTLGTVTAHTVTGAYSITLVTALIKKETVNITATDAAGNVSVARALIAPDVAAPNPTATVIQAENYTSMSGVWNEPTTDVGGGQNTGNINTGDWMAYNNVAFNVPTEGSYKITYRVASLNGGGRLALRELSNENTLGSINIPKTGAWQSWVDVTHEITLTGGEHNFKLYAENGGFNVNWFKLEPLAPLASDTTPPAQPTANFDTAGKVVSGVAEAGSTVVVKNASNTSTLGTVTADAATGAYSITLGTALINNETINVSATDAAGNVSVVKTLIAPDKTAPTAPSANLDVASKTVSGTAEIGSSVVVKNSAGQTLGIVQANSTTGAYSVSFTQTLVNGQSLFTTATDTAGNVSAATTTPIAINTDPLPAVNGLRGRYYGYHQPANGNVNLTNVAQVKTLVSNKSPDAYFIARNFQYGVAGANELGMGTTLQTFLRTDAATLNVDPANTSDAILRFDGKIQLDAGSYNFRVRADDGYSIMVNGAVVAEYSANQAATTRTHVAFAITQSGLQDIEIVYWDAGGGAFLNVELADTATGNYAYLNESILFQPSIDTSVAMFAETNKPRTDYEGVNYYSSNDALIQAMASFVSESGVDTRYRATYMEQGSVMIAVGG